MRFIDSRKPRQKHLQKKKTLAPFDTHARGHWSTWMFDLLDTHTHIDNVYVAVLARL